MNQNFSCTDIGSSGFISNSLKHNLSIPIISDDGKEIKISDTSITPGLTDQHSKESKYLKDWRIRLIVATAIVLCAPIIIVVISGFGMFLGAHNGFVSAYNELSKYESKCCTIRSIFAGITVSLALGAFLVLTGPIYVAHVAAGVLTHEYKRFEDFLEFDPP